MSPENKLKELKKKIGTLEKYVNDFMESTRKRLEFLEDRS